MKRISILLAGVAAMAAAGATAAEATNGATGAKIQLRSTMLGKLLVDKNGFTLYLFTNDKKNKDTCVNINPPGGGCTATWPVLKTKGKPVAGKGVKSSLLGTITLAHGVKQVTYAGHPLYMYKFANGPGDVSYAGTPEFGGVWDAVNAGGHAVKN